MDLSIIVPLLNEAESIPELFAWIGRVMKQNNFSYEVIFVDDLEGNRQAAEKYCGWRTFANIAALKEAKIC